uniref:Uncharacterized protein n=1 Tax=Zooxanthella nutricula TaxID=1333877 RepID=A0A7S2HEX4_9DINO
MAAVSAAPAAQQPSAAAAAGAAAAALLQKQLAADGAVISAEKSLESGWSEHQTGDGRKFYYHEQTQTCSWEKPEVLMTPEERANDTPWSEYKIWDGRSFYFNKETKVSCWSTPPELRKLKGESSGVDDRPIPQTNAEKRRDFWDLLKEKGVDDAWTWQGVSEATRDEPQAQCLSEPMRKQCFAELIGLIKRQKQIDARKKERAAASAFERLIEERFCKPEDLTTTYEEAEKLLAGEEAWGLIKSDIRRDEVFQTVMERLEEKHKKSRLEGRAGCVVRLQRLMASDLELKRTRLRWKDAMTIMARKDELQEEHPPLDALRVWSSLRELKQAAEFEAEAKSSATGAEAARAYREERRRRDAFITYVKELAVQSKVAAESSWEDFVAVAEGDPRFVGLQESTGSTAMELFSEFQEDLRVNGPELVLGVVPGSQPVAPAAEAPRKRQRIGFSPAEETPQPAGLPEDDTTNALDAMIAGGLGPKADAQPEPVEEEEEDPLMEVVARAAAERKALAEKAAAAAAAAEQPPAAAAPQAAAQRLTAKDLLAKKVDELRAMCREQGLPVSGRKQELVDRLAAPS